MIYSDTYSGFPSDIQCVNDFDYLQNCLDLYPDRPPLLYPRVQGAIYFESCTD